MPSTIIAGRATGRTTLTTMRKLFAPSILAASISSYGSASIRYWRMKNTPNALTSVGRITDSSCPPQPRPDIIMNSGTTLSCWLDA
ncbi:hypothetical protein SCALM49S_03964 [Streptomyces californicus]